MDKLDELIPLMILLGLVGGLTIFLKPILADKHWIKLLVGPKVIFGLLLGWTLIGFFFTLDYNQHWGCMLMVEPVFSKENVLYSVTALVLLSLGSLIKNRKVGNVILMFELLIWLYKLYFIKGGYVVGFGGGAMIEVLWFDTLALTLRLFLIKQLSSVPVRTISVFFTVLIIMILKLEHFFLG